MTDSSPGTKDGPDQNKDTQTLDGRVGGRGERRHNWLTGIVTGIISGALVSFYLTATGQAAFTAIRDHFAQPTCANPQWLLQVPDSEVFANAYYMQHDQIPDYGLYHVASNTIDGNLSTSWLQFWPSPSADSATSASPGEKSSSDYITWAFPQNYDVRLICVVDGWTENAHTYVDTLPIGRATVYVTGSTSEAPSVGSPVPSSMCASRTVAFKDYIQEDGDTQFAYQWQPIAFHCVTDNIVLYIDDVSANSVAVRTKYHFLVDSSLGTYTKPLTGLSEVRFYYCPAILCALPMSLGLLHNHLT
jgi:hypothetical protein